MKAILGEKLGMTQVFDDEARAIPVTVIKAGPCRVTQIKRPETDGYAAVQISYKEANGVNRPLAGVARTLTIQIPPPAICRRLKICRCRMMSANASVGHYGRRFPSIKTTGNRNAAI